jgi:predicted Zn finger-like uncharacterized protein
MILTCPECATRYFVPDGSVGPEGRTVRCASCSNSWRAFPEADAPLELDVSEEEAVAFTQEIEAQASAGAPGTGAGGRARLRAARRGTAEGLPAEGEAASREPPRGGLRRPVGPGRRGRGGVLATLAVSRESVVQAWPKSASAYAAIGLPVNPTGLVIERQQATPSFMEGRPAIIVRGSIRNVRTQPVIAPPLEITLLDGGGKALATKISQAVNPSVPAGASRYFEETVLDPPGAVAEVEVKFALDHKTGGPAEPAKLRKTSEH